MALNIETGHITQPGATGNQDITLASGFDPKAIVMVAVPVTADGIVAHASMSVGFGTYRGAAVQQSFTSVFAEDNQATSDTYRRTNTDSLLMLMDGTGAIDLEVDLVSMTTGSGSKVTLNFVNLHTTASIRLHYLILGGSDLEDAQAHSTSPTTGAGAFDVALGSGFGHPQVVLFNAALNSNSAVLSNGASISFGWGIMGGDDRSAGWSSGDAQGTELSVQRIDNAKIVGTEAAPATEFDFVLSAESGFPTDGYEITKTTVLFNDDIQGLALRFSANVTVTSGEGAARTTTGTTDLAVGSSTPKGLVLLHTRQTTAGAVDSTSADSAEFGIGLVDGSGNERWAGIWDDDAQAVASVASSAQSASKAIRLYVPSTDALDAEADGLISGSNFQLDWTDASPTAFLYEWIAFGVAGGGAQALDGVSAGTSTSTGALDVAHTLTGTSAGTSTTTGALSLALPLTGTSAGTSTTTGAVTSLVPVAGTSAGTSASTGDLTVSHTLTGTSAGTSTSTGDLIVTHPLAGTSAGTSTTTGDLTLAGQQTLAGTSAGTSTSTGALTVAHTLAGASAGTSASTGDVSVAHPLAGTSAGTSGSTGTLSNLVPVAGTSAGTSTSTGALVITRGLAGTSAGTSTTTGALRATFALEGLSAAVSTSSGSLRLTYTLAGLSTGTSVTTGDLTRTGLIEDVGRLEGGSAASGIEGSTSAANRMEAAGGLLALIE